MYADDGRASADGRHVGSCNEGLEGESKEGQQPNENIEGGQVVWPECETLSLQIAGKSAN